jgi:hypothetical protein
MRGPHVSISLFLGPDSSPSTVSLTAVHRLPAINPSPFPTKASAIKTPSIPSIASPFLSPQFTAKPTKLSVRARSTCRRVCINSGEPRHPAAPFWSSSTPHLLARLPDVFFKFHLQRIKHVKRGPKLTVAAKTSAASLFIYIFCFIHPKITNL